MKEIKITKREIIFSIVIVSIMLLIGLLISSKINDSLMDEYHKYNTALQIENDKELFEYGMRTNIGRAFVYGNLKAVDPVTYEEIGGEYSYVEKVTERYTEHTRPVIEEYKDAKGITHTKTRIEHYWTWDKVGSTSKKSTVISFLDVPFTYGAIQFPNKSYIKTIKESSYIRYVYYGSPAYTEGTLYASLSDKTISQTTFYTNLTISETIKYLESNYQVILFWIVWILFIAGIVFFFYYIDNKWLEG